MRSINDIDTDKLKMLFGLILLLALCALLGLIAFGKVYESSSYGLLPLITTLSTLAGAFSNWAFGQKQGNGTDKGGNGGSTTPPPPAPPSTKEE
jgi:hypothetical protein